MLDYSIDKYGKQLVNDIRRLKRIFVLYLALPIYWALHGQKNSRWIFQARQMNGDLGFYTIKPDQMPKFESLISIILIPFLDLVFFPLLKRCGLRGSLQKMTIGLTIFPVSFLLASIVQFQIDASPANTVHMLWQIPQYIVMTISAAMFQVIGKNLYNKL